MTSTQEGTQETSAVTNRPNIDVITAKNKEEATQDRKSSYKKAGIVATLGSGYYNCNIFFKLNRAFNYYMLVSY